MTSKDIKKILTKLERVATAINRLCDLTEKGLQERDRASVQGRAKHKLNRFRPN